MSDPLVLTTDTEITAAVARWLDAHFVLPKEPERIARFVYGYGTGGRVSWRPDVPDLEHDLANVGGHFVYRLHSAERVASLAFTPEFFRDSAVPVIPLLHRDANAELSRPVVARTVAD